MKETDWISRQAAIDEAYDVVIDGDVFRVVQVETLYGLPSAQQWIPCSERLPEESGRYLVTNAYADNNEINVVDFNYYNAEQGWWQTDCIDPDDDEYEFNLAWMPLPEPWKGVEE